MGDGELSAITGFRRLSDRLITGGQPTEEQLAAVARARTEVVINLALHGASYSLADERRTVEGLGMVYEHIPVLWEQPAPADLAAFFDAMDRHAGRRLFVHCAANMRASAFLFLYRVLRQGWRIDDAAPDMRAIWQPSGRWQEFIDAALGGRTQ